MGKLLGIAKKEKSRAPMIEVQTVKISRTNGVENDFRGKSQKRQVTILNKEDWLNACNEAGKILSWTTRRANLFVEGLQLKNTTAGHIRIGKVDLEITGETKPCERMEEALPGLKKALSVDWRGGVTCRVVKEGTISISDEIIFIPPNK